MKVCFVFDDWRAQSGCKSIYATLEGVRLSLGDFHSGSTFTGEIDLDLEQEKALRRSLQIGAVPVFRIYFLRKKKSCDRCDRFPDPKEEK